VRAGIGVDVIDAAWFPIWQIGACGVAALACTLSACSPRHQGDDGGLDWPDKEHAATETVKRSLKAPSSYEEVQSVEVWRGVSKDGQPAFIYAVTYDAQNSFGARLRGCSLAPFNVIDAGHNRMGLAMPTTDCSGSPDQIQKVKDYTEFKDRPAPASAASN
jgi:hypothetical protein